jgi:hypothetical protein
MIYAVDVRENIPGDCIGPVENLPRAVSIERAKDVIHKWREDMWWADWTAYLYDASAWDGISYGDPVARFTRGPRGGFRFEWWQ